MSKCWSLCSAWMSIDLKHQRAQGGSMDFGDGPKLAIMATMTIMTTMTKTLIVMILIYSASAFAQTDKNLRIGIVGGGPSGLSAAYRLHKAGFQNVTVLERANEVGGKTETLNYQGHTYEMGAIMSGPSYDEVNRLAKEVNEPIVPFAPGGKSVLVADPFSSDLLAMTLGKKLKFLAAALEYHVIYYKYAKYFDRPGMSQVPPELNEPFETWAVKNVHYHAELQELLSHSFVSFGYGYMSEVPAAYVMRYFSPRLLRSFIFGQVRMIQGGYQNLWKKIAASLDVKTNFEVEHAHRENNIWRVKSKAGESVEFDNLIWTAPLDGAVSTIDLPAPLQDAFSKISYQFYNSSLVEVEGLPHGSGVVTKNYDVQQSGHVVSWLYRWPSKTNVANFYTLSDGFMTPEQVEAGLRDFATKHNFKIKKVVKSVGWKYFPHYQQSELDERSYSLIESEQGRSGLYFGGELMNFSTVEHSAEYSRDLVDRFFVNTEPLSTTLPKDYARLSAKEKLSLLWGRILASEYVRRPTYKEASGSLIKELVGFLPSQLSRAFNNRTDVLAAGREKIIHKLGSTALLHFEPSDSGYNSFDALIRISNAVDGSSGTMYPSFSIKIPGDQDDNSINFSVGKSFDGQHVDNNWKGKPDYKFFRDDAKYPFSNELPMEPRTTIGKAFKWVFDRAHLTPNYISVGEMSKVMNKPAPRRFIFRAPPEIQDLNSSSFYSDEREVMSRIPPGSILFNVYESTGLNDPGRLVGVLRTTTRFVASRFGDRNLYFRHEDGGVKKPLPSFSQARERATEISNQPLVGRELMTCRDLFGS
jgi:hypothetical protein